MRDQSLIYFFAVSTVAHIAAIPLISALSVSPVRQNFVVIDLLEVPQREETRSPVVPSRPSSPLKVEAKPPQPMRQPAPALREGPKTEELPPKKDELEKSTAASSLPGGGNNPSGGAPGKGSGVENFPGGGDVAVLPGSGFGKSGTRIGSGPPGPGSSEKVSRPAKPVQTAKASYPPMALRMGIEADVPLKVFVDEDGRVVKVEIVKSVGMGFADEALKAVRQYRFEPALSDGRRIPSEFTYIYRFRLEK
jgi:protein TonB